MTENPAIINLQPVCEAFTRRNRLLVLISDVSIVFRCCFHLCIFDVIIQFYKFKFLSLFYFMSKNYARKILIKLKILKRTIILVKNIYVFLILDHVQPRPGFSKWGRIAPLGTTLVSREEFKIFGSHKIFTFQLAIEYLTLR